MSHTNHAFGEVVLVPFPFSNQSGAKKRPALIVSSSDYNRQRPDVIIMAVTSREYVESDYSAFRITDW